MTRGLVVIPVEIDNAITAEIDRFLALYPEAEPEREKMRSDLLGVFDEYGFVAALGPKGGSE